MVGNKLHVIFYKDDMKRYDLKFSVIIAFHKDQLVLVKHKDRETWEIPGGHIEEGESAIEAARRELNEETGAYEFRIHPICTYSVSRGQEERFGKLYYSEIDRFEELSSASEIDQVEFFERLPDELTYPLIQAKLYDVYKKMKGGSDEL